jgi:NAD(P)-dependent dehydrogenase (short-subunit alcohol dehydrogenase family)
MPGAVVIGVGPGIGLSVARRFARGGMPISVIARTRGAVDAAAGTLRRDGAQVTGLLADSTDEGALRSALERAEDRYGVPDVLVYNAALVRRDRLGELSAVQLAGAWAVNVGGAVTAAARTGRKMAAAGHGTMIITGGLAEPLPDPSASPSARPGCGRSSSCSTRSSGHPACTSPPSPCTAASRPAPPSTRMR